MPSIYIDRSIDVSATDRLGASSRSTPKPLVRLCASARRLSLKMDFYPTDQMHRLRSRLSVLRLSPHRWRLLPTACQYTHPCCPQRCNSGPRSRSHAPRCRYVGAVQGFSHALTVLGCSLSVPAAARNDNPGIGMDHAPGRGWLGHGKLRRRSDLATQLTKRETPGCGDTAHNAPSYLAVAAAGLKRAAWPWDECNVSRTFVAAAASFLLGLLDLSARYTREGYSMHWS